MDTGSVGSAIAAKTTFTSNVTDCDNNKLTVLPGSQQGTMRLCNRESNATYRYQITFL